MTRERIEDRWLDTLVVGLVVLVVAFAATAPRAASDESTGATAVQVVAMPARACADVHTPNLGACLAAAHASATR